MSSLRSRINTSDDHRLPRIAFAFFVCCLLPTATGAQTSEWSARLDSAGNNPLTASFVGTEASLAPFNTVASAPKGATWFINTELATLRAIASTGEGQKVETKSSADGRGWHVMPHAIASTRHGSRLFILDRQNARLFRLDASTSPLRQVAEVEVDESVRDMCAVGEYLVTIADGAEHTVSIFTDDLQRLRSFTIVDALAPRHPLSGTSAARLTCLDDSRHFMVSGVFTPTLVLADIEGVVRWATQLKRYRMPEVRGLDDGVATLIPPDGHHMLLTAVQVARKVVAIQLGLRLRARVPSVSTTIETRFVSLADGREMEVSRTLPRIVGRGAGRLWFLSNGQLRHGRLEAGR